MKFNQLLTAGIAAIIFFSSCQKELSPDTATTPNGGTGSSSNKIKTYTEDVTVSGSHSSITLNINYDGSNRITSMVSATSAGDKFVFEYPASNTFNMDLYNSNVLSIHEQYLLNSFSFLDSTFQYNDTHDTMTEKYFYNASKQLVKLNEYDYSKSTGAVLWNSHTYTYDANGSTITDTDLSSVTTYDYYTNLAYNFSFLSLGMPQPKFFVKTTKITSGGSTETYDHTYKFDSSNRLTTETITDASTGDTVIKTYTYY